MCRYTVTFSEAVTGVSPADFQLVLTGTAAGTVVQVTPVDDILPSGSVYMVTVSGIKGNGTLGLDLVDNGSIFDLIGNPLTTPNFTGQVYTVGAVLPFVQSIIRTAPIGPVTNAATVSFTVTFSEPVTGVIPSDFHSRRRHCGDDADPGDACSGLGLHGHGQRHHRQRQLGLDLVDNGSIHDLAGNPLTQQNGPAAFQIQQTFAAGPLTRLAWRWVILPATAKPTSSWPMMCNTAR